MMQGELFPFDPKPPEQPPRPTGYLLDDDDRQALDGLKPVFSTGYAMVAIRKDHPLMATIGSRGPHAVARIVMILAGKTVDDLEVDHRNGNKLDNRKCNLAVVTKAENSYNKAPWGRSRYANVHKKPCKSSGVRGARDRWLAQIQRKGRVVLRKTFLSEIEAALCVDKWKDDNEPWTVRRNRDIIRAQQKGLEVSALVSAIESGKVSIEDMNDILDAIEEAA